MYYEERKGKEVKERIQKDGIEKRKRENKMLNENIRRG